MKNQANVVIKKGRHSRMSLSGIYNACRCQTKENTLLNGCMEDPQLDPALRPCGTGSSGMTLNLMGFTPQNKDVVLCPPCGESTLKGGKGVINKETFMDNPPSVLRTTSPTQGGKETPCGFTARSVTPQGRYAGYSGRLGFTLIELLVVVLIIGILAAIAVPQYQKAVQKARLSEFGAVVKTAQQAMDAWLLENGGFPDETTTFTGFANSGKLSIDFPGTPCTNVKNCMKLGGYDIGCTSFMCGVSIETNYNIDGTTGNNWLNGGIVGINRFGNNEWALTTVPQDLTARKIVCQWWQGSIKDYNETGYTRTAKTDCAEVGVE